MRGLAFAIAGVLALLVVMAQDQMFVDEVYSVFQWAWNLW